MQRFEILTVEDTFWLNQNGVQMLILHPDFSVPKDWHEQGWSQRKEPIVLVKPDGKEIDATAQINMTHLNIPDPRVPRINGGELQSGSPTERRRKCRLAAKYWFRKKSKKRYFLRMRLKILINPHGPH
jgi:hypothetical protein